eukprot:123882-Pyramimonas_sp.AAC.1
MAAEVAQWGPRWRGSPCSRGDLLQGVAALRAAASSEPLGPLVLERADGVLQRLPGSKAKGCDAMSPLDLQRLPAGGRQQYVYLLNEVEALGTWPEQVLLTVCCAVPQPAGGDRVIGPWPTVAGAWSRARASIAGRWSEALAEHWDTTVK